GTVPGTWRLQPGRLEQLQPELTPRREARDGVGEPVERDLADDGDRRGMQHLTDLEADEGGDRDHAVGVVEHEPRGPGRVAADEASSRGAVRGHVDGPND